MTEAISTVTGLTVSFLLFATIPYCLLLYFFFRYRDLQEKQGDRFLGFKAVLHGLYSIGIYLCVLAVTGFVIENLIDTPDPRVFGIQEGGGLSSTSRAMCALLVTGLIIALVARVAIGRFTNDALYPMVRRFFAGARFTVASLVTFGALAVVLQILFARGEGGEPLRVAAGVFVVWLVTAVLHLFLLLGDVGRPNAPGA